MVFPHAATRLNLLKRTACSREVIGWKQSACVMRAPSVVFRLSLGVIPYAKYSFPGLTRVRASRISFAQYASFKFVSGQARPGLRRFRLNSPYVARLGQ